MNHEQIAMILDAIRDHERGVLDDTEGAEQEACQRRIDLIEDLTDLYREQG